MVDPPPILPQQVEFNPLADFEAFLKNLPAKWAVYLMTDESDRPVQLLCVKNLRYSLKRRLGDGQMVGMSKRIDYRSLVRKIHWRRVDSAFEADAVYLEAAREFFPKTYRGMHGFLPAWFLHVNPDANFPRYTKTINLDIQTGMLIGPIEDKHSAGKLIEDVVDWFDLCRYYGILVQAPDARACAYKEMGKCPAPCDGSISMDHYRYLIQWSAEAIVSPRKLIEDNTRRMQQAAVDLKFETAAKIKSYIESLSKLGKASLRYVRLLRDFKFISIQRGPRDNTAKIFLITPGEIREIADFIDSPNNVSDLLRLVLSIASEKEINSFDEIGAERMAVASQHLFEPKATRGAFLPLDSIDENQLIKAFRDVQKQKKEETFEETEGVVKELQML
jgi:excinuclease UvrABC nuclease subunit